MAEQYENNYETQLNGSINSSVTTLTVDAVPTTMSGDFRIKIDNEIILVGQVSGSTFVNCLRGQEGTTAASHSDNAVVTHVLTAAALESIIHPLDNITLHPTYGDHFRGPVLDSKWTRVTRVQGTDDMTVPSWLSILPTGLTNFGDYQSFTDSEEFEIQAALSFNNNGNDWGFGIICMNTSNTGLWVGFRATSRMGLFTVTTGTTGTEPISGQNLSYAGSTQMGHGRKYWVSLIKKQCAGTDTYWWRFSLDGGSWTKLFIGHQPSAFTPARIGWWKGVQGSGTSDEMAIDWFNVKDYYNDGNNLMTTPSSGTVTATSDASSQTNSPSVVIDGNVANEWYFPNSNTSGVHWKATFSVAQSMNRLRFRGRNDSFGIGRVEIDGNFVGNVNVIGTGWNYLDFPTVSASEVKIIWHKQNHGTNPGFQEIEAYLAS